ncbi:MULTISPECIES: class I SAM-dependent methyltransferase [unclassified Methanoregula]|uniref:class I SAM-dependent methyltransferase n=1 Tax=unclassified Methanoregula TaxID=2649730 RepID=UPI0009CE0BD8|nr:MULTISPECIES: class I SAM-dependent methyltransferase [unclassified Methanoregula]OPX61827.1 MAG: putative S-adenosylmethionine-dependent methyltransferase [Methanoregula sp. PtaB.Bin085]OPY35073.1 MAG: putative S-adenosylmethionine-dependent methyltransferase [Methanoregula sp. PtaU1.Bin006]
MTATSAVDWVRHWEEIYDGRLRSMQRDYSIDDWTERAGDYSERRKTNQFEFGDRVYRALASHGVVGRQSRVLEVGSGPGTFVIPFAKRVKSVTAVEPSDGMIRMIRQNTAEAGIGNYDIIRKTWQDVNIPDIRGKYDLVITSTVIWMFRDILQQIERMEEATSGHCCVVEEIDGTDDLGRKIWRTIMGEVPCPPFPGYPIIYNILYQNGRVPQVRIVDATSRRTTENLAKMYRIFYSLYTDVTPEIEEKIGTALAADSSSGIHEGTYRSAVVWWDPEIRWEAD